MKYKLTPNCEIEAQLMYHACLKCKFRKVCNFLGQEFIDKYEQYAVEKYHERLQEQVYSNSDPV